MQAQAGDEGVFIRSMATRGHLGGLSRATHEAAYVLDAAGKDWVVIETVGVGQDEVDIVRTADVAIVVLVPGTGDEVQALKAGIMEIADIFVVNKADREGRRPARGVDRGDARARRRRAGRVAAAHRAHAGDDGAGRAGPARGHRGVPRAHRAGTARAAARAARVPAARTARGPVPGIRGPPRAGGGRARRPAGADRRAAASTRTRPRTGFSNGPSEGTETS